MKIIVLTFALLFLFPVLVSAIWLEDSLVLVAAMAAGALALVAAIVCVIAGRRNRKIVMTALCAFALSLGGIASVAIWDWPLRLVFLASRPALERAAADARSGREFTNRRVGLFLIRSGELGHTGIPCLWVDTNSAGRTGLVQTSPAVLPFNLWSAISLDEHWQLISED